MPPVKSKQVKYFFVTKTAVDTQQAVDAHINQALEKQPIRGHRDMGWKIVETIVVMPTTGYRNASATIFVRMEK